MENTFEKKRGALPPGRPLLIVVVILAALLAAFLLARRRGQDWTEVKKSRFLMNTLVTISARGVHVEKHGDVVDRALDRIAELGGRFNRFDPSSEISLLNLASSGEAVRVSADTFDIIFRAQRFWRLTGGAFDITVRPIIEVWKGAAGADSLPSEEEIAKALFLVGSDKLLLDPAAQTVRFATQGMEVDLGAIAKGYAADAAADVLKSGGISNAVIDIGGDLVVLGQGAPGKDWTVGVQSPDRPGDASAVLALLEVRDRGVATSGPYYRFYEIAGRRFSHIVDPATGRPADEVPSVTAIAPDGVTADAWATALSVLGVERGMMALEAEPEVQALFLVKRGEQWEKLMSSGFEDYVSRRSGSKAIRPAGDLL